MKKITLTQGYFALVDDEDFVWLSQYKWQVSKYPHTSYAVANIKIKNNKYINTRMHRLILGLKRGDNRQCDHIDHNGLNNQKSNLRICNRQQNNQNRKLSKHLSSKYKGVNWDKHTRRWLVRLHINNKSVFLGRYDDEKEAAKIYDRVALFEFKEFAHTNFSRENYSDTELLSTKQILKQRKDNKTSKFTGVHWDKQSKKWRASIRVGGKLIHLGYFKDEKHASCAYKKVYAELKEVC